MSWSASRNPSNVSGIAGNSNGSLFPEPWVLLAVTLSSCRVLLVVSSSS